MGFRTRKPTLTPLFRLDRPTPRVVASGALRGIAASCIDVSDGLLADLGHVCAASGVGAEVELASLPLSPALRSAFDEDMRRALQATGGDDYELCFTAPESARTDVEQAARATRASRSRASVALSPGDGVAAFDADGNPWTPSRTGYAHFA